MRIPALLACVAFTLLAVVSAHAETTVQVVETWPAGDTVTLHRNQNFYLHLHYTSDEPVHIWARPYFQGEPAHAGSNPSQIHPAGSGEALGWFFLDPGAQVDEVQIRAGDGTRSGTRVVAEYPVQVFGGNAPAGTSAEPEWASRLRAEDKAAQDAAYHKQMSEPVTTGDLLFMQVFMLTMAALGLLGLVWPAWGLWRWRGIWRILAAVPAAITAFVVLRIVIGTSLDPTSHNLWPFEVIMAGGISIAIMIVLAVARRLMGAQRTA